MSTKGSKATPINARCYLSTIASTIAELKPLMTRGHHRLLQRTPFSHMLELAPIVQDRNLLDELLSVYDEETNTFQIGGSSLEFRADDVALVLGLSCHGRVVKTKPKDFTKEQRKTEFIETYFSGGSDRNKDRMQKELHRLVKEGPSKEEAFVQLLLAYIIGVFLVPTTSLAAPWWVGCYVSNLYDIGSFAWAQIVHSWLMEDIPKAAAKVKERRAGKDQTVGYLKGCVIALNIWFYEVTDAKRRQFEGRFPRILCYSGSTFHRPSTVEDQMDKFRERKVRKV